MSRFDSVYQKKEINISNNLTVNQTSSLKEPLIVQKPKPIVFPLYYFYRSLRIVLLMWILLLITVIAAPWADYYVKTVIKKQAPETSQVLGATQQTKKQETPVTTDPESSATKLNPTAKVEPTTFFAEKGDLKIQAPITKGITDEDLTQGLGHHPDSAWPNQKGNVVIAGHSFSLDAENPYGRVFEKLRDLEIGDEVSITHQNKKYIYKIFKKETVSPSDVSLFGQTDNWQLTFYTCDPPKTDWRRLVFQAELIRIE